MLKHEGIPVKLMAGIPFCREIIHQEIKVKKTIILTLLLITALAANGCGNKKNVTDMKDKETTVSAVQQETTQLSTQKTKQSDTQEITPELTMNSETQQEETTEEEKQTVVAAEVTDSSPTTYETVPQAAEPDNNSFAAGYAAASQYSQLVIVQSNGTNATVTMHELQDGVWTEILRTDGFVGSNGVGEASEFTSATPQGTFPLYFAFGINPNPGTKVPYLQVDEYDYWVGDSSSPLYNQYARADSDTDWDKSESERIIDYPTAYGYCLFIGYNIEGTPGKGRSEEHTSELQSP